MKLLINVVFILLLSIIINAQTVYITKTGSKNHSESCSYLKKSSYTIDLKEAINRGYTPCSRCKPTTIQSNTNNQEIKKDNSSIPETTKKKSVTIKKRCIAITKKRYSVQANCISGFKLLLAT